MRFSRALLLAAALAALVAVAPVLANDVEGHPEVNNEAPANSQDAKFGADGASSPDNNDQIAAKEAKKLEKAAEKEAKAAMSPEERRAAKFEKLSATHANLTPNEVNAMIDAKAARKAEKAAMSPEQKMAAKQAKKIKKRNRHGKEHKSTPNEHEPTPNGPAPNKFTNRRRMVLPQSLAHKV